MSAERYTVDTNILFYALDKTNRKKQDHALEVIEWVRTQSGFLVFQTLEELCNSMARKHPALLPAARLYATRALDAFNIAIAAPEDLRSAFLVQEGHGLPFWDAMLWATAQRFGGTVLLSEDFQDGRMLGNVTFRNPFKVTTASLQ